MELVKQSNFEITKSGELVLNQLRDNWGTKSGTVEAVMKDEDGRPYIGKKVVEVDTTIKRLNKDVAPELFHQFASLVKEQDVERISNIIKSGLFEVEKAIQAFEVAPTLFVNKRFNPADWEDCKRANSPSLVTLSKYKGEETTVSMVFLLVKKFCNKFGKRNDMNETLIKELAEEIVAKYYQLLLADVIMILNDAVKASKDVFNIDYQGVLQLFEDGYTDKVNFFMKRQINDHEHAMADEKETRFKEHDFGELSNKDQVETFKSIYSNSIKPNE